MSEADLPAIAMEALRAHVEHAIADLPGAPTALVSSPWRAPEHGVFVHLHALAPILGQDARPRPATSTPPSAGWALRVLIGAFGPHDLAVHRLMGRVAATLQGAPVLTAEALAAAARALELDGAAVAGRRAQLMREDLGIDDMTRLWQRFAPMRYSLSEPCRILLA
ncbi:Pvc16 family protein [Xanthobacter sp. V4C-4]|uniref:Pvc16 family protein n=1 Tax=Xanthobacter cornucopiae TaxID=3119924 RepID=UPI003728B846